MKNAAERRSLRARLVWGANPVSREGERPRPVAFARTGKLVRTAARFDGALPEAQRDYCGSCRLFEVPAPQAANSIQELQIESGTRIRRFANAHDFPKFVKWVRRRGTNFGKWALAAAAARSRKIEIGIGGSLTAPPLPHHQDIRVRIRRFGRLCMSLRCDGGQAE
jgi:hypothetical protein